MADYDTRLIGAGADGVTRDGVGSFLIWFGATEPDPPGTGKTLDNPSFEIAGSDGGVDAVDFPASWEADAVAFAFSAAVFGSPYRWSETFEGRWGDNHDALTEFDEGTDLTQGTFGVWPRETTYEGFFQDWGLGNQDAIDAFADDVTDITVGEVDAAGDEAEDFEEEWQSRHAIADIANGITATWSAENLAWTITRLNEIKLKWNAHLADADVHGGTADSTNTITSPDATDGASAQTLAEEMWNNEVWDHIVDGGAVWHRAGYTNTLLAKPWNTELATVDSDTKAWIAALLLTLYCDLHLDWESNTGPGYFDAFEDFSFTPTNIFATAITDGADDLEDDWEDNHNWISAFDPGDLTQGVFATSTGTETFEGFEAFLALAVPLSVSAGTPTEIDPSHACRVEFTGTFVATMELQGRRNDSGQWLVLSTITNPAPVTSTVAPGYKQLRINTTSYTSGTPVARLMFGLMI